MHKIDSNPASKNWTLYYKDGIPVIGSAARMLKEAKLKMTRRPSTGCEYQAL